LTITITAEQATSLRARLDRLMAATNDLTDSAHRPLIHTLNTLGDIADQTPGLDITDWSQLHMHAMTALENSETERLAGRPFEAWARELKGRLNALAGVIYHALGDDLPEGSEDEPAPPAPDSGECSTCPCCSAEECEDGQCLDGRTGAPGCPCTAPVVAVNWGDLPPAPPDDTADQRDARAAEGHPCLRCPKAATAAYVVQTDAGPRWLDLCAADSDALVRWLNRQIVVTELPTPANPDPEPPASPMVALAEFLSTR
jgi:hypothetical protein